MKAMLQEFGKQAVTRIFGAKRANQALDTAYLWSFGLAKVPLILICRPIVVSLSNQAVELKIPLRKITKNHVGSMYFGALAIGADCAGGLLAMKLLQEQSKARSKKFSFVFKDLRAEFLKRADGDVHFLCNGGKEIDEFVQRVITSEKRQNQVVQVIATVPKKYGEEPVAKFELTLSAKSSS